jgi:lysozyme family protein
MRAEIRTRLTNEILNFQNDWKYFIDKLWKPLMRVEGGGKLHNVAGDSGGWTIYGISYNNNKDYFTSLDDFKKMSEYDAQLIAFSKYYINSGTQFFNQDAKDMYFDMAYNLGIGRAIKIAQKIAGIKQDGVIGAVSKTKFKLITEKQLTDERVKFYYSLVSLKKFLKGWLNRVNIISKID